MSALARTLGRLAGAYAARTRIRWHRWRLARTRAAAKRHLAGLLREVARADNALADLDLRAEP